VVDATQSSVEAKGPGLVGGVLAALLAGDSEARLSNELFELAFARRVGPDSPSRRSIIWSTSGRPCRRRD
jgi:hypothetical protein